MANIKYFADVNGQTIELSRVWHDGSLQTKPENFWGFSPAMTSHRATRRVEYKPYASKHECDARCINATGRIMKCECACGGKNHGKGAFNCTSEAA
jgi:hypothetical protein